MSSSSSPKPADGGRLCVLVHAWPRLSMTFVAQELVGLESQGLNLWIATYGKPDAIRHPIHDQLKAEVHRLADKGVDYPRFLRAFFKVRRKPGFAAALALFRRSMKARATRREWRSFARGVIIAAELPADIRMVYAHFIGSATTVARYAAMIAGLPLAASAHARDIWTSSEDNIRDKLSAMDWCTTCTKLGAEYLQKLSGDPAKVHLIYHGLSFDRFPSDPPRRGNADGSDAPVQLLSVGRAVEKKGFDVLLDALSKLPANLRWHWTHVGGGKILDQLQNQAEALGLSNRISSLGAQDQRQIIDLYRGSDLFVLPCREASDGDRDGLPNVLMEAQSQALACLSTDFSEIPELIIDGQTGVLVPPADAVALTEALDRLIRSPEEREQLGLAGYKRVRSKFEADGGIREIAGLLRKSMQ